MKTSNRVGGSYVDSYAASGAPQLIATPDGSYFQLAGFNTPLTVYLTIGLVPEPSMLALSALTGLCGLLALRRRK